MAGNAFQTAIECMVNIGQKDTFGLGQDAVAYFNNAITDPNNPTQWAARPTGEKGEFVYWVDDYGWWGDLFIYSYNNADALGYSSEFKDALLLNAEHCWEALNACWDPSEISWTDIVGPLHVAVQHTITGGIPNISDDTQKNSELAGRNCVTN